MTGKGPEEYRQWQKKKDFPLLPKTQEVLNTLYASFNEGGEKSY